MSEALQQRQQPNQRVEENGLATITSGTTELAPTSAAAREQHEIQSAIVVARRFPRSEDAAFARLMKSAQRTNFAEAAEYSFPRGGQTVTGPSVDLAREAARIWGNIRYGLEIIRDDEDSRQIQGWAWDLETNTKIVAQDDFRKLVQRKQRGGPTAWVAPDERDLRELTNRRGAILVRNCILQLLPADLIEDALEQCHSTLANEAKRDPDSARKKLIVAFGHLNITPEMLEAHLGHPLSQCAPAEIATLRGVFQSIRDGNSSWEDATGARRAVTTPKATGPERSNEDLLKLTGLAEDKGIPPLRVEQASQQMFQRAPRQLSDAEFTALLGWVENGGNQ